MENQAVGLESVFALVREKIPSDTKGVSALAKASGLGYPTLRAFKADLTRPKMETAQRILQAVDPDLELAVVKHHRPAAE